MTIQALKKNMRYIDCWQQQGVPVLRALSQAGIAVRGVKIVDGIITVRIDPPQSLTLFSEPVLRNKSGRAFYEARLAGCRIVWELAAKP